MAITVTTRIIVYPRFRIVSGHRGGALRYSIQIQTARMARWRPMTANGRLIDTTKKEHATRWMRWLQDPEGTRHEWDTPDQIHHASPRSPV